MKRERLILAFLALGTLALRLLTLMEVNTGGDNIDYWYYAKSLLQGYPYDFYFHRSVRWGIILPTMAVQLIFGFRAWVIYVPPLLMSLLLNYAVFLVGKRLMGRKAAYLAIIIIQFFPYMIRMGSQLFLGVFSMNYLLFSLFFLLPFLEEQGREKFLNLFLAALFMFVAYLTKITNLYFLFPWIFFLWKRSGVKTAFTFGLILLGFYLVEHLAYIVFLNEPLGRLGVIMSTHLENNGTMELGSSTFDGSFLGLFQRFSLERLPLYWQFMVWGSLGTGVFFSFWGKTKKSQARLLTGILIAFVFCITFGIKGVSPYIPFENFHSRYFVSLLPFGALLLGYALSHLLDRLPSVFSTGEGAALFAVPLALLFVMAAALPLLPPALDEYLNNPLKPREHIIADMNRWEKDLNSAGEEKILLRSWTTGPDTSEDRRYTRKSIDTVNRLFLSLEKGRGKYLLKAQENDDGTRYAWIDREDGITPESHRAVITAFRMPFELKKEDPLEP